MEFVPTFNGEELEAYDQEVIAVGGTAVGFTAAKINPATGAPARMAVFTLETANIRYYLAGVPTTTVGHLLVFTNNPNMSVVGYQNLKGFRAISAGAASLTVTYYR